MQDQGGALYFGRSFGLIFVLFRSLLLHRESAPDIGKVSSITHFHDFLRPNDVLGLPRQVRVPRGAYWDILMPALKGAIQMELGRVSKLAYVNACWVEQSLIRASSSITAPSKNLLGTLLVVVILEIVFRLAIL